MNVTKELFCILTGAWRATGLVARLQEWGDAVTLPELMDSLLPEVLNCETVPADPPVKYFPRKAVVTTLLPRGVPLKPRTEVVYV